MMNNRIGRYITQTSPGETYKAYIPASLPPVPSINLEELYPLLEKATRAIGELNSLAKILPNADLFIYMYVRKESLLSSQIEGTQSSFSDLVLFENHQRPQVSLEDVEEVSNYVQAIKHGLKRMKEGFPLSLRLLCETHKILLQGGRGASKLPGEFRRSQNWIGGTRPGNALFVPPPPEHLMEALGNLEYFFHQADSLPILIKAGIAHVQFETIHPFLDGNGRLGRLLIILMLCNGDMLEEPILYISLYLKENRALYYQLLQEVRIHGTWEVWLEFFLEGIYKTAASAAQTMQRLNDLFMKDANKLETLGRARLSCQAALDHLKKLPQVDANSLAASLGVSPPTARSALNHLIDLGIVEEISRLQRDKVYVYRAYLDILEEGAEPL